MSIYPLNGIVVLDLTRLLPGPYCTMLLADLGAEVIKVEEPGRGDYVREMIPGVFEGINRNKKSMTLNLKHPRGKEIFLEMVKSADIVIESYRPGVMARLGLGYEELKAVNEGVIYCALSGFGQDGPYASWSGHDVNYLGVAGVLSISGTPQGPPAAGTALAIADLSSAMFAAVGVLAALQLRHITGKGQFIDVSMTDGLVSWMARYIAEYMHRGGMSKEELMVRPGYGVFATQDGRFITVGAMEDVFWQRLIKVLELTDRFGGEEYSSFPRRREKADLITTTLQERFLAKPAQEWLRVLTENDVPCGPVNFIEDLFTDPHVTSRGLVTEIEDPHLGSIKQVNFPIKFSEADTGIRTPAPLLGQHTAEVLARLGISAGELEVLRREGVA